MKVGKYKMGPHAIEVFAVPGADGSAEIPSNRLTILPMRIGMDQSWAGVVGVLLHEAFEIGMVMKDLSFWCVSDYSESGANYHFMLDHAQFSDLCGRAGTFISAVLPDLAKVHKNWGKK